MSTSLTQKEIDILDKLIDSGLLLQEQFQKEFGNEYQCAINSLETDGLIICFTDKEWKKLNVPYGAIGITKRGNATRERYHFAKEQAHKEKISNNIWQFVYALISSAIGFGFGLLLGFILWKFGWN